MSDNIKPLPTQKEHVPQDRPLNTSLLLEIYGDGTRNSDFVTRFPKNFKCPPKKSSEMIRLMEMHFNALAFAFESMINFYEEHDMVVRKAAFDGFIQFMMQRYKNDTAGVKVADLRDMHNIIRQTRDGQNITKQLDKIDR